jgi:hypothetical protein
MERSAILGVYDYIGYGLCKYMLDLGVEIEGIDLSNKPNDYFTEEKRMEIGRNANFSEVPFKEWNGSNAKEIVFISLYQDYLDSVNTPLEKGLLQKLNSLENVPVVLILPAYLAQKNAKDKLSISKKSKVTEIYLPTIFGPWQPEGFFFQQALNWQDKDGEIPEAEEWEWTADAIYIDDAIRTIVELSGSGQAGSFLVTSGTKDRWQKCAEELLGKTGCPLKKNVNGTLELRDSITVLRVDGNEEISKGLLKQKEQYSWIQDTRD